ncbi:MULTISPECIES: AraC family transcriptional regulator [Enterococcus]|uniref:AraC family transcriptional regulator n=1 Tax=Enterococcus TaxID=1350 RepID=UPI0010F45A4C|nr:MULTISPECIES: AraC family transcriptional regulator [Enterococcus]KAF1301338.1 hypothetical protein BAU16_10105 [Enterococcus sp. JM9B]
MKITLTKQFQEFVKGIGLSLDDILQRAEIPNLLWKEEVELSPTDYSKFLFELDSEITDEQILAFSEVKNIQTFMPPIFVALCAKNALEGFHRFARYKRLICPLEIDIQEDEKTITIHLSFDLPNSSMPRFSLINEQLVLVSLIRTGTGKDIKPLKVKSPYPYSEELTEYLGITPEMSATNAVTFRLDEVVRPYITHNNVMWEYLEPELKRRLAELSEENMFINLVEKTLFSAIPSDWFSREEVAKSLGVSVRTMQRKLGEQGTTYAQLVQKVQELLAVNYIHVDELATEEISYLVGYKDQASFSRAFKKWTGKTVTEYKARLSS